jgi:Tfp pilus assembly protein PilV
MLAILLNKKGISLVEALIAVFLTGIAAVAILVMQDTSWRTGAKSDYFGRAAGILQTELELRQDQISRPSADMTDQAKVDPNIWPLGVAHSRNVHVIDPLSNAVAANITGDKIFTVTTAVTSQGGKQYLVNAQVTWPGTTQGIRGSMIAVCTSCP